MQSFPAYIEWGNPENGWWLLTLPAIAALLLYYISWKKRQLQKLADSRLLQPMLKGYSPKRTTWSLVLLVAAMALLCAAMINPQEPEEKNGSPLSGMEVVLAIDVSNSMLSTDISPNRLERAKLLSRQLIDTMQGNKVGVVAFAGEAWLQLPITSDLQAARLLLSAVNPQSIPVQGTDIANALQVSNESMPKTDLSHKAVVLFTDGEELDGDAKNAVEELKKSGVMLISVGMATPAGATVVDEQGLAQRKEDGSPVISQLNEEMLTALAKKTNGRYIAFDQQENVLNSIIQTLNSLPKKPLVNSYMVNYYSYSHWLMVLAIILLMLSVFIRYNNKPRAALISKVAMLMLAFVFVGKGGFSQETNPALLKADEYYKQGKLTEAELQYKEALKANPSAWNARLHLGNIAYRRGRFDEALEQYESSMKQKIPDEARVTALNNKALAYAKAKKLPEAVDAFKQAIRVDPFDAELQRNLGMALEEMKKAQQQPPPPADPDKMNKQKANDRLKALQEEEKKIRQQLAKQRKTAKSSSNKNW